MYFKLVTTLVGMLMFAGLASAAPFAYITNLSDNTVSVVDTLNNSFIAKVPLGAGQKPYGIAISADGSRVYISNQGSKNISVIDALGDPHNPTIITTLGPLPNTPSGLAIDPAGTRLYVANQDAGSISVIDVSNLTPSTSMVPPTYVPQGQSVGVETFPVGVAVHPSGSYVYVTNSGSDSVFIIRTSDFTFSKVQLETGSNPMGIAAGIVNNAMRLYVANFNKNSVSVIDPATNQVVDTITQARGIGVNPYGVALSGNTIYVSNSGAGTNGDSISVINGVTNSVTKSYSVGTGLSPQSIAVTKDGNYVYTVNNLGGTRKEGSLSTINLNPSSIAYESITQLVNPNPEVQYFFNSPKSFGSFIGPQLYTINAAAGSNGTITPVGDILVGPNATPIYTITPNVYYRINNVAIDGTFINLTGDPNLTKDPTPGSSSWKYTFQPVNTNHSIDVTFIKDFDYVSVTRTSTYGTGAGAGTVISTPSGINCSPTNSNNFCNALFQENAQVRLEAQPDPGKWFAGWKADKTKDPNTNLYTVIINNGNACDASLDKVCTFTMSTYTHYNAEFIDVPPVARLKTEGKVFKTFAEAFAATSDLTKEVQLAVGEGTANVNLNTSNTMSFLLTGGWDTDYTYSRRTDSPSTIAGSFTLSKGSVIIDNIVIK